MTVAAHAAPALEGFERGTNMATLDGDLGSVAAGKGASLIGVQDAGGFFAGKSNGVEGCLAALGAVVGKAGSLLVPTLTIAAVDGASHKIDCTVQVKDAFGNNVAGAKKVLVTTVGVTADKGDIGAPAVVVAAGTIDAVQNPITGDNTAACTTDATGLLTFSAFDDVAEKVGIAVFVTGALPVVGEGTGG